MYIICFNIIVAQFNHCSCNCQQVFSSSYTFINSFKSYSVIAQNEKKNLKPELLITPVCGGDG